MIDTKFFFDCLKENNVSCFCGVPDSLLKDFCAYITDNSTDKEHTITANEGNAVGIAAGHYLATGHPAVVYMQNSGIGNCINPLLSLTDQEVYNIPLLMLIGWRGEPNKKDEPQHVKQGKITDKLLETVGIKYEILPDDFETAKTSVVRAFDYMNTTRCPFAFIIRKGTFAPYALKKKTCNGYVLQREDAIKTLINGLSGSDVIVSTTGHISREVYATREQLGQSHRQDFLVVGSMGHASSVALGIALEKTNRNVYCFDGDGAFLMHGGACVVNASKNLSNFKHIVFNNEAHDSVGSQPTAMNCATLSRLALNSGYKRSFSVETKEELLRILPEFTTLKCTALLEIKVKCGARKDLPRPKEQLRESKKLFMSNLQQVDFCYRRSIEKLSEILREEKVDTALMFTGKKSYERIRPAIEKELTGVTCVRYSSFSTNPKKEEIDEAISKLGNRFDVILAIGGGSVMDFAKLFRCYTKSDKKLIAIPTTCGTGAESTQFATVYIDGIKHSVNGKGILPDYGIADSQFVDDNPLYLKACTAMDAYCHAIESYWSKQATNISREYAVKAIKLCRDNIVRYVNSNDKQASDNMMFASHFAGKAINISKTTVAHALSYKITSDYGIPHGHAVSLTIAKLFDYNVSHCNNLHFLKNLITQNPTTYFNDLFDHIHLETNVKKIGSIDIKSIVDSINVERLVNNPIELDKKILVSLFT